MFLHVKYNVYLLLIIFRVSSFCYRKRFVTHSHFSLIIFAVGQILLAILNLMDDDEEEVELESKQDIQVCQCSFDLTSFSLKSNQWVDCCKCTKIFAKNVKC